MAVGQRDVIGGEEYIEEGERCEDAISVLS
jgi:hypothetical protein